MLFVKLSLLSATPDYQTGLSIKQVYYILADNDKHFYHLLSRINCTMKLRYYYRSVNQFKLAAVIFFVYFYHLI